MCGRSGLTKRGLRGTWSKERPPGPEHENVMHGLRHAVRVRLAGQCKMLPFPDLLNVREGVLASGPGGRNSEPGGGNPPPGGWKSLRNGYPPKLRPDAQNHCPMTAQMDTSRPRMRGSSRRQPSFLFSVALSDKLQCLAWLAQPMAERQLSLRVCCGNKYA